MDLYRFTLLSTELGNQVIEEPEGWDEFVFTLDRHDTWHGVFEKYDKVNLRFNKAGYRYIKELYDTHGINYEGCTLLVEWQCGQYEEWEPLPVLKLNFTRVKFGQGVEEGCYASIDLDPTDAFSKFLNRYDQKVNIDAQVALDGAPLTDYSKLGFDVQLQGQTIRKYLHVENDANNYADSGENYDLSIASGATELVNYYQLSLNNIVLDEAQDYK
jgi:hypothetical protein